MTHLFRRLAVVFAVLLVAVRVEPQPASIPILQYIHDTWGTLTRSNHTLAAAAVDPKFHPGSNGRRPVYLPSRGDSAAVTRLLRREMSDTDFRRIELRLLPADLDHLSEQGLWTNAVFTTL